MQQYFLSRNYFHRKTETVSLKRGEHPTGDVESSRVQAMRLEAKQFPVSPDNTAF